MWPEMIVERQIALQAPFRLTDAVIGVQIDFLVLDASPEPLYEHIVTPAASPVHADGNTLFLQKISELHAGKLAALVGVEDLGRTVKAEGFLSRLNTEIRA